MKFNVIHRNGGCDARILLSLLVAFMCGLPARADYSSTVRSFNPIAYWRLNETGSTADAAINRGTLGAAGSGVYLAGAVHPATTSALVGSADTAANFPNVGRVVIPWNAAMNPPGAFTVECWANSTAAAGGSHTLVQSMVQGQNPANVNDRSGWNLREVGADLQFLVGTASGAPFYYIYTVAGVVSPGTWQHIVVVYDGTAPSIYINGVLAIGVTVTRQEINGTFPMTPAEIAAIRVVPNLLGPSIIGNRGYGGWNFDGDIDEVAIYASALSATDVLVHYQNGTSTSPSPSYDQLVGAKSPPGYYRLGEPTFVLPTAVNVGSLGSDANGTYSPGTVPGWAGPPYVGLEAGNFSCLFDGTGDIDCGNSTGFDVPQISIAAWIKVDVLGDYMSILAKGNLLWRFHMSAFDTADKLEWLLETPDGPQKVIGNRSVVDGQWHHAVAVYDGINAYIYLDGTLDNSTAIMGGGMITKPDHVYIGSQGDEARWRWNGNLDEVAVFNYALSASQVSQLYSPPLADASATHSPVISANGVNTKVILDGSRTSDQDGALLQYVWWEQGSATALASGVVASAVLPVGIHTINLVVSDGLTPSTSTVSVTVLTTRQAVQGLIAMVNQSGLANSRPLTATLVAALAAFNQGNSVAAANQLHAFQNQVSALVAPSNPVLAQTLIGAAQQVIKAF